MIPTDTQDPASLHLTGAEQDLLRAMLKRPVFTNFDLANLTGMSRVHVRKLETEISKRLPNLLIQDGTEPARQGRPSKRWRINPAYRDALLARLTAPRRDSKPRVVDRLGLINEALAALDQTAAARDSDARDLTEHADRLLDRATVVLGRMTDNGRQASEALRQALDRGKSRVRDINARLDDRSRASALRTIERVAHPEPAPVAGKPDRDVIRICNAPPGDGRDAPLSYAEVIIRDGLGDPHEPRTCENRNTLRANWRDETFLDNVCQALGSAVRNAARVDEFTPIARRFLSGLKTLLPPANNSMARNLGDLSRLEQLDSDLRTEVQTMAEALLPRGQHRHAAPFALSGDDSALLRGLTS